MRLSTPLDLTNEGENIMTSLIRRSAFPARTISKRELFSPFDELINTVWGDLFPDLHKEFGQDFFLQGTYPKVNVLTFDNRLEIEAAIPGLNKENVDVEVVEGILTIRGGNNQREDVEDSQYARREVKRSAFARSFQLGENLDENAITAAYENGILTLTVPKLQPT